MHQSFAKCQTHKVLQFNKIYRRHENKMKILLLVTLVGLVAFVSSDPGLPVRPSPPEYINRPQWKVYRYPRSANPEPQGSIVLQGEKPLSGPDRRPTINLDYQHNIWEGKNGHVSASGGGQKLPGQRFEPHVGIQGTWRFRRSPDPEPQGSIVLQGEKPLSGPDRRPTINLDYQHNIWEGKNGHVSASGGAQKLPGQRFEPHVGIQGTWRFRRSADPEPQTQIFVQQHQPYNRPGNRFEPHVGVSHTWRFRRSPDPEPQGSIVLQGQKPLSGPDRRPTINLDYQHKIWEGKNGHVSASGGGQKLPGQRFEPHVGIQGTWRFRRSADPEPQTHIFVQGHQPFNRPGNRIEPHVGVSHTWRFRRSADPEPQTHIFVQGHQPFNRPGNRIEPHVGVSHTWRFRRSPDPEPQGSIVLQGEKPLSGHDRRPTINLDYQHKIWEGKNGHVSASGGGQKLPGQRFEPHVGIQGTWRFRRSADPEPQTHIFVQGHQPFNRPGNRIEPHVGVSHTWRFRRSPDPEPQGSIVLQGEKPLSGHDRRPTINLDYQHKIWEGKNGHVSASGGGQKLPGQRFEPHVGIQGTWRFRRSADPEPQTSIYVQRQQPYNRPGNRFEPHVGVQHTWRF